MPDVWLVYVQHDGVRCYWIGPGRGNRWRCDTKARDKAARFGDMHAARAAVAATPALASRLARIGYELLPPKVQQLELDIEGATA